MPKIQYKTPLPFVVDTDDFSLGFGGLKKISSPELSVSIDMIESVSFLKYEVKSFNICISVKFKCKPHFVFYIIFLFWNENMNIWFSSQIVESAMDIFKRNK